MIKFSTRRNLIYVLLLILSYYIRKIILILIGSIYEFTNSIFFTTLMFLGEMTTGFIINKYQKDYLPHNDKKEFKKGLIYIKNEKIHIDSRIRIYLLYFMIAFFDFVEFTISVLYLPKYREFPGSLENRLCGLLIIISSLIYYYILKFPIFKHHLFSLIIIGICLIIVIISEIIFHKDIIFLLYPQFIQFILLIFFEVFFLALLDCADKYLMEYNSIPPCKILIFEGFIGAIFSFIGFIEDKPILKMKNVYDNVSAGYFVLFIFLLFMYFVFSGFKNIYRLLTNKLYSPMAETLANYFLNPFFMIYDYTLGGDYTVKGEQNFLYFIINLILSIVISFTGFVYNEFIVLFCCGLEHDTYKQISERAANGLDDEIRELNNLVIDDDDDE